MGEGVPIHPPKTKDMLDLQAKLVEQTADMVPHSGSRSIDDVSGIE